MSEYRKSRMSRRDFLRLSAVAAGGLAAARGFSLPRSAFAQDTVEITTMSPGRDLGIAYDQVIVDTFNANMEAAGKPFRAVAQHGPATDNDYVAKINLDAASGQAADVTSVNYATYQDMVAAGYLADITDLLNGWDEWAKFAPVIKDQITINDKVYGVSGATTFTMFYRKDVLEKAGISTAQPKTWEDFYGICDDIVSKTGAVPAGLPGGRAWGGGTWEEGFRHVWLGYAESNQIYDPADGKWVIKSEGLLKALQVYETLAKNKWLTVEALLSPNPWEPIKYQGFVQGTVAMATGGDWQWEFDWGPKGAGPIEDIFNKVDRWLFPSAIGEPFPYSAATGPWAISVNSKSLEGAFEFLKSSFTPEGSCKALETYFGGPSAISDYGDKCDFYNTAISGKMAEAGKTLANGRYLKSGPGESKIVEGIGLATENIISLTKTSEQAMEEFAAQMKDQLGEEAVKEL
ncbi:MAG: extracellular solute-binding protein [Anaerolineae bacterium]|nr:extracellular solute-binding protein [Anaerolineae bacterium]